MKKMTISVCLFLLFTSANLKGSILDGIEGMQRIDISIHSIPFSLPAPSKVEKHQNWAGYVAAANLANPVSGSVSSVSTSWIVPTLESAGAVSIWTGIDGYYGKWPERLGTLHTLQGEQRDYVWVQFLPGRQVFVKDFPLNPQDHVAAEVNHVGDGQFNLVFINYTQKVYFDHFTDPATRKPFALCETAEWMVESSFSLSMLPDFRTISFSQCSATIDSVEGPINNTPYEALNMKYREWGTEATTSDLSPDGRDFGVTWVHY